MSLAFGFVVHPLSPLQRALAGVRGLSPRIWISDDAAPRRIARFAALHSATGATTRGEVRTVAMLPRALLDDQARAVDRIVDAVNALAREGAGIAGLGSLCAVVGLRGEEVAKRAGIPVTTGVSFTAFAAARTLDRVAEALGERVEGSRVAIAGFPGALAGAVAELVAARRARVVLVDGPEKARAKVAEKLRTELGADVSIPEEASTAVREADFVMGASSTGGALEPDWLREGSVVIDVAEPRDLPARAGGRPGVLVVDGENVSLPPGNEGFGVFTDIYNFVVGQRHRTVYACFAEPIVLALEGRPEAFSLGKEITRARAEEIGALGAKHGFAVNQLLHRGQVITPGRLTRIAALRRGAGRPAADRMNEGAVPSGG